MEQPKSNAEASLAICSLFESELLLRLMLIHWKHPKSEDAEFQGQLLEAATEVLQAAAKDNNQVFIEGLPGTAMNLVAAIWYAENRALEETQQSQSAQEVAARSQWLNVVRRALPSCFCDPDEFEIPRNSGIYLFYDQTGYLYIGEASNLRTRVAGHLDHSDRKALARYLWENGHSDLKIELHSFDKNSDGNRVVARRAYESSLIQSREPRFNLRG